MIDDWATEIVKNVLIQQRIEELDSRQLWRRYLPEVAAGEDEIAATELRLGFRLEERYRSFLRFANGWRCFYQEVDLFGTPQLLGGSPMDIAREALEAMGLQEMEDILHVPIQDVLVIAASSQQSDLHLLGQPWSSVPGQVMWISSGAVERFPTFDEFFLTMLDYNRREIQMLEAEAGASDA